MPTQTLELYDGVTTLDLIDESNYATQYTPGLGIPRAPHVPTISGDTLSAIEFKPRTISMVVDVLGTTQADMTTNIAALERMLSIAQERQINQEGTKVVLIVQQGTTAANDVSYTVLNGSLSLDESALRGVNIARLRTRATLTLLVEPFGKLPVVTLATKTLHNESDNFVDIAQEDNSTWNSFYVFDGITGRVDVPAHAETNNIWAGGGTIKWRFRDDPTGKANGYFLSKFDGSHNNGWAIVRTGAASSNIGNLLFTITFSNYGQWQITLVDGAPDPVHSFKGDGTWYWIEIEYDSDSATNSPTFKITPDGGSTTTYTVGDGSLNRDTLPSGTVDDDSGNAIVIADSSKRTQTLSGGIDDVRIYEAGSISDTLTAELGGSETSLAAYFKFNEGSGTNLVSLGSMGAGAVGTLTSGEKWDDGLLSIKGNAGGLLQVLIEDNSSVTGWTAAKTLYIATRSGIRRTDTLFSDVPNAATHVDADILGAGETSAGGTTGGPTALTSGGTSAYFRTTSTATSALQTGFLIRGYFDYQFSTPPKGLFRVLARCQVIETASNATISTASIFGFALGWNFGGVTSTPVEADRVAISAFSQWELLDLGEINIAPIATPEGFTDPTLSIRVNACVNLTGGNNMANTEYLEWSSDQIFLLPIDEGSAIINSIDTGDEVLLSLSSDPPGAWLLNRSSVTQQFAEFNGSPIRLGPEATRVYWLKDDPKDPSSIACFAYISYVPLVSGI